MSDVALVPVQELRLALTLTPDLAEWVCAIEDGAALPRNLPPAVIAEASRQAALADRLMTPVPTEVIRPWLAVIAGHYSVQRVLSGEQSAAWARTIEIAMTGMPAGVFTRANLGEVLAQFTFVPTAAQLMQVLMPDRDNLERRTMALAAIAGRR